MRSYYINAWPRRDVWLGSEVSKLLKFLCSHLDYITVTTGLLGVGCVHCRMSSTKWLLCLNSSSTGEYKVSGNLLSWGPQS